MSRKPTASPSWKSGRALWSAALLVAGLGAAPLAALAADEPISVIIDRAKVMRISRPADTVIIGNPAIADATIQDNRTLIITGRTYGTTNLIVLDSSGQAIADDVLTVTASDDDVVTVFKRASRVTLSCTPDCSPTLTIGDQGTSFVTTNDQIQAHNALSDAASGR
jgi:Flp pilus assembly secretin CpaC